MGSSGLTALTTRIAWVVSPFCQRQRDLVGLALPREGYVSRDHGHVDYQVIEFVV